MPVLPMSFAYSDSAMPATDSLAYLTPDLPGIEVFLFYATFFAD